MENVSPIIAEVMESSTCSVDPVSRADAAARTNTQSDAATGAFPPAEDHASHENARELTHPDQQSRGTDLLAVLTGVEQQLAACHTVEELATVVDAAELLRQHAKICRAGFEVQYRAAELRIRAERAAGAILLQRHKDRSNGATTSSDRSNGATTMGDDRTVGPPLPTLAELGITKSQSSRWQQEASVSDKDFSQYLAESFSKRRDLTSAGLIRIAKRMHGVQEVDNASRRTESPIATALQLLIAKGQQFRCLYADPPWSGDEDHAPEVDGGCCPEIGIEELCQLPVARIAADQAHLHLWVPSHQLFAASEIFDTWGFRYQANCVWVSTDMGVGDYWRTSHMCCLLGVRGNAAFRRQDFLSWFEAPGITSAAKPELMRDRIMEVSSAPFLELFGIEAVPGWTVIGRTGSCFHSQGDTELHHDSSMSQDSKVNGPLSDE